MQTVMIQPAKESNDVAKLALYKKIDETIRTAASEGKFEVTCVVEKVPKDVAKEISAAFGSHGYEVTYSNALDKFYIYWY